MNNIIDRFRQCRKYYMGGSVEEFVKTLYNLGETVTPTQKQEIQGVWNYLTKVKGLSSRNTAAIMGNVWQESRFNPKAVSSAGARGYLQFKGDRLTRYNNWKKTNKFHPKYGQFDYILYAINDLTNSEDFYRTGYESTKQRVLTNKKVWEEARGKNKIARKKDYDNVLTYFNDTYGAREQNGQLYFLEDLRNAMNNPKTRLDELTTLWHHTIEKSGVDEMNLNNRLNASREFYNYFK